MRTEIKEETIEILKAKGFVLSESRFPYTYHHDYVRENTGLSREDIALMLRRECLNERDYVYSCCYVAILYLLREQPELVDHDVVNLLEHFKMHYKELNI